MRRPRFRSPMTFVPVVLVMVLAACGSPAQSPSASAAETDDGAGPGRSDPPASALGTILWCRKMSSTESQSDTT